jgi:hypothetical protein
MDVYNMLEEDNISKNIEYLALWPALLYHFYNLLVTFFVYSIRFLSELSLISYYLDLKLDSLLIYNAIYILLVMLWSYTH